MLIVCTGNVCRSPYIERRLRAALVGFDVHVSSAGSAALVGQPMSPGSDRLLAESGIAHEDFVARQLSARLVEDADVIIGAGRDHIGAAARLSPRALQRGLALLDLADLLADADLASIRPASGRERGEQITQLARSHRPEIPARSADNATIMDPYGRGEGAYRQMADQIEQALPVLVAALCG